MNIFHLSTVHSRYDNRILNKECSSLSRKHNVTLIVSDGKGDEMIGSVRIVDIGKYGSRLHRMIFKSFSVFSCARKNRAEIYHIHDPELIIPAFFYHLAGGKVIYDIHEDHSTSILQKGYLPRFLRKGISWLISNVESYSVNSMYQIIAEKYYHNRFPAAVEVLNYPVKDALADVDAFSPESKKVIYTGNATRDRGALLMADAAGEAGEVKFKLVGKCIGALAEEISLRAKDNIEIIGVDKYVPFNEIVRHYSQGALAGVAVFPRTPHYLQKELTKFFEYMAVGLPIIASDFPVWKKLIEDNGVGICVNPDDRRSFVSAIEYLEKNPEIAREMGRKGRELIVNKFNWEAQAQQLSDLYDEIEKS